MDWKRFGRDYLYFSRKDRTALLFIFLCMAVIYAIPLWMPDRAGDPPQADSSLQTLLSQLQIQSKAVARDVEEESNGRMSSLNPQSQSITPSSLFTFDPNTLAAEGWIQLGLSPRVARTIINYRSKGGRFYKPEDLQKIWGLPPGFYARVEGHIRLERKTYPQNARPEYPVYSNREPSNLSIANLNMADTTALIALPGIGSKLATRILAFRDKMGGFYAVSQVADVYGLPDSTFQKIKPYLNIDRDGIKKINVNIATKDELKVHPYIRWNLANAIVEYRLQHGAYTNLDDLRKLELLDEITFQKLLPYLQL